MDKSGGRFACWEWTGGRSKGYGTFFADRRGWVAHRYAYELLRGKIPAGLALDHLCENRACVNPVHLDPVDNAENVSRSAGNLLLTKDLKARIAAMPCKAEARCILTLILRRASRPRNYSRLPYYAAQQAELEAPFVCTCPACGSERAS